METLDSAIEDVLKECFWGDYNYSIQDIKKELESGNRKFGLFLFTKILNNARYPSRYIRILFPLNDVSEYLNAIQPGTRDYDELRRKLVMSNVLGVVQDIRELSWKIK